MSKIYKLVICSDTLLMNLHMNQPEAYLPLESYRTIKKLINIAPAKSICSHKYRTDLCLSSCIYIIRCEFDNIDEISKIGTLEKCNTCKKKYTCIFIDTNKLVLNVRKKYNCHKLF